MHLQRRRISVPCSPLVSTSQSAAPRVLGDIAVSELALLAVTFIIIIMATTLNPLFISQGSFTIINSRGNIVKQGNLTIL